MSLYVGMPAPLQEQCKDAELPKPAQTGSFVDTFETQVIDSQVLDVHDSQMPDLHDSQMPESNAVHEVEEGKEGVEEGEEEVGTYDEVLEDEACELPQHESSCFDVQPSALLEVERTAESAMQGSEGGDARSPAAAPHRETQHVDSDEDKKGTFKDS